MSTRRWSRWVPPAVLALFAGLPAWSLLGNPGAYLAGPYSEIWVKIWAFQTFSGRRVLGGVVESVGFPNNGLLNNPDPLGSLVHWALAPVIGSAGAYNLLVVGQLWAAMVAVWLLASDLTRRPWASIVAGVGFGLTPLVLVYPVACGITDILNLWPYPLALLFGLRALRRGGWRDGALAGIFAGLGFVTCPHNFVVFSSLLFPLLAWLPLAWRQGLVVAADPLAGAGPRQWPRAALALALGFLVAAGWYVLWMKLLMGGAGAQVSEELVAGTRHQPPFRLLHPEELKRFTAFLGEYFAIGADGLVVRDMISRFYRAFSPGFALMGLGLAGLGLSRGRRLSAALWVVIAVFCAIASTGPFLPWSAHRCFDHGVNIAWLALHYLLPGGKLVLEPFRYALVAAMGLAVAAAVGAAALERRFGVWVSVLAPLVVVAELLLLSPVPVPLPVASLEVSAAYDRLDEVLPPGPIIELPYFDQGTQRFQRRHFVQQLRHGRPIADEVVGFPPRYLVNNQFTAQLLALEKPYGELIVRVERPELIEPDRQRLQADGFVGVVVDPQGFDSHSRARRVIELLEQHWEPIRLEDRLVFVLDAEPSPDVVPNGTGE